MTAKEINIHEQIDLLIQLQKVDLQIYELNDRKNNIPLIIKKLEDEFALESTDLKQEQDNLKSLLVKQKDMENDLGSKEETIKKCEGQLYQIKTNKEYTAMQHEIAGYKADKSVLEDNILTVLEDVEAKKDVIEEHKKALKVEEDKLAVEKAKVNIELKEIEARLASLNAERTVMAPRVDKVMLGKYDRLLKGKSGSAMVPVRHDACGGCNMNLPPQVINEIKMKEDIIFCQSCARILYIEE